GNVTAQGESVNQSSRNGTIASQGGRINQSRRNGTIASHGGGNGSITSQGGSSGQSSSNGQPAGPPGRARLGGCGNAQLGQIMQNVVPTLMIMPRMKLGDIAQMLQQAVQRATLKSFEIMMGKGDMITATHQMSESTHCRVRVGEYYTTVYETPVQYDVTDASLEQELSNIDFGEPLGGSGYPGQRAFPRFDQIRSNQGDITGRGRTFNQSPRNGAITAQEGGDDSTISSGNDNSPAESADQPSSAPPADPPGQNRLGGCGNAMLGDGILVLTDARILELPT
ncbi:hypothetical protein PENTCL1PPCAC_3570, partial [Pristionchus entomophagus]